MSPLLLLAAPALASGLQLYAHDPHGRPSPLDTCDVPFCDVLLDHIEGASKSIDVAIYGMRSQTALMEALGRAKARGVRVRLVVDMDREGKNYYSSTEQLMTLIGSVQTDMETDRRSSEIKDDLSFGDACERPQGFLGPLQCLTYDLGDRCLYATHAARDEITFQGDIMHDKFVVVDRAWVWTGSTNLSDSCSGGYNANLALTVDSPVVGGWYTREFEQMYAGKFHGEKVTTAESRTTTLDDGSEVQVLFSPQDKPLTTAVRPALQAARNTIDVAVFFLTHKDIALDLIEAHKRGVKVRVMIDSTGASNEYSKHEILREAGIPVKVDDFGGKLHAKSAIIDGRVLVAGSMNWTNAGEGGNDENTLMIRGGPALPAYQKWFDLLWKRIDDRWLKGRPDAESLMSPPACTDGVDNDHDHLADAADPGCAVNPPPMPTPPPHRVEPKPDEGCEKLGKKPQD